MSDYLPCQQCGHHADQWHEIDGVRWAVTAPRSVTVSEGEPWTCTLCAGGKAHSEPTTDDSTTKEPTLI